MSLLLDQTTVQRQGSLLAVAPDLDVCDTCFNFTRGYRRCFACASLNRQLAAGPRPLAAFVPISYSVGGEVLHHLLSDYKRRNDLRAARATRALAAVLGKFLAAHEGCLAAAAGTDGFDLVTTVPSSDAERDERHPLRHIVGQMVGLTRSRHRRVLQRTQAASAPRTFDPERYCATEDLVGRRVLLIDDTWTTGANALSAAASLRAAGAVCVAAVVLGRHVNRGWYENDRRLDALDGGFNWSQCALCAAGRSPSARPARGAGSPAALHVHQAREQGARTAASVLEVAA